MSVGSRIANLLKEEGFKIKKVTQETAECDAEIELEDGRSVSIDAGGGFLVLSPAGSAFRTAFIESKKDLIQHLKKT